MSNSGYNYRVDAINDGVSLDGENSFFTYVVDPNPLNNVSVSNEDLFLFVRLRAFPQNRSVITSDNVFNSVDQDKDGIYFIASTTQNDKGYLTTNYTNIGQLEGTVEGLGIKNISIDIKMFTPPTVEITFVDVRGAAVFNNYENYDGTAVYNTSKFNAFFRLPYPIFELTVKGFYGKATTYYLNLVNFNASVDTSSGDFVIKCKFVGYQFAFLNDILTKYVIALNNTTLGQQYLKDYIKKDKTPNLLSIPQLLQKYTEISVYTEDFKKEESDYELLKILNTIYDQSNSLLSIIGLPATVTNSEYGAQINYENFNYGYLFFRDIGLFSTRLDSNISVLQDNLNKSIDQINKLIDKYVSKHSSLSDLKIKNFTLIQINNYSEINDAMLDDIQSQITTEENNNFRSLYNPNFVNNKIGTLSPYFTISFYDLRKTIYESNKKIKDEKIKYEEQIVEKLNKTFVEKIGFNPTVFNVFEIIFGNVDIFLDIVYNVCKQSDSLGEERVGLLKNYFNINSANIGHIDIPFTDNRIYPFPAVYDLNGEQVWLGDIVGENNPNYPELKLVNDIISGLTSNQVIDNVPTTKTYSNNIEYKWVPINPLDYSDNLLNDANNFNYGDPELSELYASIYSRMLVMYLHTGVSDSKLLKFAETEAANFASKITNNNVKLLLQNIDPTIFVNRGQDYYVANPDILPRVGSYGFTSSADAPIFFYEEYNPATSQGKIDFESSFLEPNVVKILNQRSLSVESIVQEGLPSTYKCETNNYAITTDLTLCFKDNSFTKFVLSEYSKLFGNQRKADVPYLNVVKNIKLLDGDLSGTYDNGNNKTTFYKNNAHNTIGQSLTNYKSNETLFDVFYYTDNSFLVQCFLFLETLGFKDYSFFESNLNKSASIAYVPDLYLAYLGGMLFFTERYKSGLGNPITLDINVHPDFNLITDLVGYSSPLMSFPEYDKISNTAGQALYNLLINVFLNFAIEYDTSFEDFVKKYVELGKVYNRDAAQEKEYQLACDTVLKRIQKIKRVVISSPSQTFGFISIYPDINLVNQYTKIFCNTFKSLIEIDYSATTISPSTPSTTTLTVDKNLKIEIYNHLKNIYDKWLSYSTRDGKIYNFANYIKGGSTTKRLIDHCYFIDRTWSDIGDLAVLNPKPLLIYTNQTDGNIYYLMSRVLKDNNFNVYSIPTYVNYYNKEDVSNMFRPFTFVDNSEGGACFVFQYVAGNSKILDLNARVGYFNDGFDFNSNSIVEMPKSLLNRKIPSFVSGSDLDADDLKDYLAKYNLCVFRVAYADQNQNIFSKIEVSQEEHRETAESILIQNEIAGGKGGTKRLYTGMDLFNVYAVRSYQTNVECLGNTQILPSQYFQLDNIPLFHGAHMITSVKHYIEPHNMVTSFSGRRISKFSYPIVDKMTTFLNLELNEKIVGPDVPISYEESGDIINGEDNINYTTDVLQNEGIDNTLILESAGEQISPSNPLLNDSVLFRVVEGEKSAKFVLSANITFAELQNRLQKYFTSNNVSSFGLSTGLCASWVRTMFLKLGVVKIGNASTDAWNWFMGLPKDQNMYYFSSTEKQTDWSFEDYQTKGVKNGSIIFGYFVGSRYKDKSYRSMKNYPNGDERRAILKKNKRITGDYEFSPITHIGIYYNGIIYDLTRGVTLSPHKSFVPIAFYHFLPTLENLAKKHG